MNLLLTRRSDKETRVVQPITEPTPDTMHPDHLAWWAAFSELVSKMPRQAEQCRLSVDPVHRVHGSILSINDCAMRAIDAAYDEGLDQMAHKYEEQAGRLMASYDRHVRAKVSICMDKKMIKYILITVGCALFALVFLAINAGRESSSVGLMAIVGISLIICLSAVVLFVLLFIKKKRILGSNSPAINRPDSEIP